MHQNGIDDLMNKGLRLGGFSFFMPSPGTRNGIDDLMNKGLRRSGAFIDILHMFLNGIDDLMNKGLRLEGFNFFCCFLFQ